MAGGRDTEFWLATPLRWCQLDGAWLVFQAGNGLVCELDGLSALLLSLIEQRPMTSDELLAQLSEAAHDRWSAQGAGPLHDTLSQLQHIGLIDRRRRIPSACM